MTRQPSCRTRWSSGCTRGYHRSLALAQPVLLLDSTGDLEVSLQHLVADVVSDQEQSVADEVLQYGPLQDAELQLKAEVKGGTGVSSQLLQHLNTSYRCHCCLSDMSDTCAGTALATVRCSRSQGCWQYT
jgi:hypothetical protein